MGSQKRICIGVNTEDATERRACEKQVWRSFFFYSTK